MEFLSANVQLDDDLTEEKISSARQKIVDALIYTTTKEISTEFSSTIDQYADENHATLTQMDEAILQLQQHKRTSVEELLLSVDKVSADTEELERQQRYLKFLESNMSRLIKGELRKVQEKSETADESPETDETVDNLLDFINNPQYAPQLRNMPQFAKLFQQKKTTQQQQDPGQPQQISSNQEEENDDNTHNTNSGGNHKDCEEFEFRDDLSGNNTQSDSAEETLQRIRLEVREANFEKSNEQQEKFLASEAGLQDEMSALEYELRKFSSEIDSLLL